MIRTEDDARAILLASDLPLLASRTGHRLHIAGCCDHATYPLRPATSEEAATLHYCWDCAWGLLRVYSRLGATISRLAQEVAA